MKVEWKLFAGAGAFYAVTTALYWFVSYEHAGSVMLALSVPAFVMVGVYLLLQSRRTGLRPEDRPDASIDEGEEEIGYFPSSSVWPLVLALGAVALANSLVFGLGLAALGVGLTVTAAVGYAAEANAKG
ncbi:MAG: cytochrome c oxidase subunit 4 [Actinomycetota bacterium]|nr:cytochrome c oxidase subunit 4 [Actinomycetota bacterium]